ncbi:hypothetical protein AAG906_018449 [Vitis piasezkii]
MEVHYLTSCELMEGDLKVINFVDYSLNQGAPAGHESVDTPNGHESNGVVARDGVKFTMILFQNTCDLHHKFGNFSFYGDTSCVCQIGYKIVEKGLLNLKHLITRSWKQLVIRPHIVPLLPTFHGMESENPYAHIKEFEDVCNTFREGGASIDLMRLKLFPFTLKDKAKIWLNSLRPRSIRTWTDLQAEFLKKFFPTHRTNGLKRQISNFSAKENEKFYECWERYIESINACPHHGFDTFLLVSYFYDGMSSSMKQLLETMCGGDFMSKNPKEAMDFLSYVAEISRMG